VASLGAIDALPPALIVAVGAVPGAWIRWACVRGGGRWLRHRHWATWMVNMWACFLLGLLVALQIRWDRVTRDTVELALAIGFLGSLSTFSTLIAELVTAWRSQARSQALRLGVASVGGGLLACLLGQALGRSWP
jgi:CrcB protein